MATTVIAEISPPEQRAMGNGPVPELQAPLHDDEGNLGAGHEAEAEHEGAARPEERTSGQVGAADLSDDGRGQEQEDAGAHGGQRVGGEVQADADEEEGSQEIVQGLKCTHVADGVRIAAKDEPGEERADGRREATQPGHGRHNNAHAQHHEHGPFSRVEPVEQARHGALQVPGKQKAGPTERNQFHQHPSECGSERGKKGAVLRRVQERSDGKQQRHQQNADDVVDLGHVDQRRALPTLKLPGLLPDRDRHAHARGREGRRDEQAGHDRPADEPIGRGKRNAAAPHHVADSNPTCLGQLVEQPVEVALQAHSEEEGDHAQVRQKREDLPLDQEGDGLERRGGPQEEAEGKVAHDGTQAEVLSPVPQGDCEYSDDSDEQEVNEQ